MQADRWQRIDALFHATLACEPGERAAFLAEACGGDETLRREVEELLDQPASGDGFLRTPALDLAARMMSPHVASGLAGRRLGPYEIVALVGAGGMGEVYRARDTSLGREVALKVLPHAFIDDPDRLARLEREARVLAALNHPNIATIHGFEHIDAVPGSGQAATRVLVMELVEGETLADRIAHGSRRKTGWSDTALPMTEALTIARQMAEAIDAAHGRGIVHRDLKPANIKIRPDGTVKVLDFGLATVGAGAELAQPPALEVEPTRDGAIVGTAAYMSPEQARGQTVDKRTDIWAFGCILYEMLTGRAVFARETVADTLAAVVDRQPDWDALPAGRPARIARLLQRCLEKDPKRRLRDIGDALADIEDALAPSSAGGPSSHGAAVAGPAMLRSRLVRPAQWLVGATLVIAGAATGWHLRPDDSSVNPLAGATFTRLTDWDGAEQQAALSRDGRLVAFIADRGGTWDAWVGQIGTGDFQNLTKGGVPELRNPAVRNVGFTPDASLVTLWVRLTDPASGVLTAGWAVPTLGGQLRPYWGRYADNLADVDWSPDGRRLVYHTSDAGDPMFVADADGTVGRQIYTSGPGLHNHFPLWSPDEQFVYFVRGYAPDEMDLWRMRPTGGSPERLTFHESRVAFPTFLDNSTLLYLATAADRSGPWIHALDLERGVSERIATGVEEYTSIAASANGRRLVATMARSTAGVWRAALEERAIRESATTRVTVPTARGLSPRLGPGYMIYRAPTAGSDSLWKLTEGEVLELWAGRDGRVVAAPAIAPDGRQIAFPVQRQGVTRLYVMNADGSGARPLTEELDVRGAAAWSPDGAWIASAANRDGQPALFKVPVGGGAPVLLVEEYSVDPVWSPSGRFLVYSGTDVGTTFPVKAVTSDGRPHPFPELILSRGARRLAFLGSDRTLMLLKGDISHKELWSLDLETGSERQLTALGLGGTIGDFDVSADGREVVFDRTREESDIVLIELGP